MKKLNPCVIGSTKVLTVNGIKTFKELADSNDDVDVYCLNDRGEVVVSKMIHPRVTGYNVEVMKVTLDDNTVLTVTPNHEILTRNGYVSVEDLTEDDHIPAIKDIKIIGDMCPFGEYKGTKKGTVIKVCEVTGEEFETTWDEREICSKEGYEKQLYEIISIFKSKISDAYFENELNDDHFIHIKNIELLNKRENVYNGTVAWFHNYFTVDENTSTIVNQLNCGE